MSRILARLLALAAVTLAATLAAAVPAQAATVRQIKTVKDGTCVRPYATPADLRAQSCSTKPTKARDWASGHLPEQGPGRLHERVGRRHHYYRR
jgi:hypothetical protein